MIRAEIQEVIDQLPNVEQSEVLYALGFSHVMCQRASDGEGTDDAKVNAQAMLDAAEAEAAKRNVPPEVREVIKKQAEIGKFVVG